MMYALKANGNTVELFFALDDAMAAYADRTEAEAKIAGYVATYYTIDKVKGSRGYISPASFSIYEV